MSVSSLSQSVYLNEQLEAQPVHLPAENELSGAYAVFRKIRDSVSNIQFWKDLFFTINSQVIHSKGALETILTSCAINQYVLSILLLGEERAREVMNLLTMTTSEVATFYSSDGTKKINFLFYHLLSGNGVICQNEKYQDPSYQYVAEDVRDSLKDSSEYIVPLEIFKENIQKSDLAFLNYNHNVINALEAEIKENSAKISSDVSYLYHVAITGPRHSLVQTGTMDKILSETTGFFHTFILEQYYSPDENKKMIRLHQSWQDTLTLGEYYEKVDYNDKDRGCFDSDGVKAFCENLRGLFSFDEGPDYKNQKNCLSSCFSVDKVIKPYFFFRPDINLITGFSVRYVSSKVNPQECLDNIDEAIRKYG